jgi:hypothetical protein
MLGPRGYSGFADRIRRLTEATLRARLATLAGGARLPPPMVLSYLSHASYGALVWWLEEGMSHSPEQMARWLHQLTLAAFQVS